jgi:hypothetical protein
MPITNAQSNTRIDEIGDGIYRISTPIPPNPALPTGFTFNQYLVIDDEPLLYFLAGIPSAAERAEFALYLLGGGVLSTEDARTLIGEHALLELFERARPLVVDYVDSPASARFRAAFPAVADVLATRYAARMTAGGYRLLAPRAP